MINPWYMEQPFLRLRDQLSVKDLHKLRRFYTQQLALSVALLDGKPLGICKITTSGKNPLAGTSVDDALENYISQKGDSKEMSS